MLERIGSSKLTAIRRYLERHYAENILLLNDLRKRGSPHGQWTDDLYLSGYRREDTLLAVQGFYRFGRWMPHFVPEGGAEVIEALTEEMQRRRMLGKRLHWLIGARRVVDPLLQQLGPRVQTSYDELDHLLYVDLTSFCPCSVAGVRRARREDQNAIAALRVAFEVEYFGVVERRISKEWCYYTAGRYVEAGTYVAERQRQVVAMVSTEASLPQLIQIGAVYTASAYRNQGLARGVVSAICDAGLQRAPRVALTVKIDNTPALRVYRALGFQYWLDYRMTRFG